MPISYTKLAIVLLRIQGLILTLQAIPIITMTVIAFTTIDGIGRSSNYILASFLQLVIKLILYIAAVPLATGAVSFLDRKKEE